MIVIIFIKFYIMNFFWFITEFNCSISPDEHHIFHLYIISARKLYARKPFSETFLFGWKY